MKLSVMHVKRNIAKLIPKTFGLIIDGRTIDAEHFNGFFITWSNETTGTVKRYLICCNVAEDVDEETQFAEGMNDNDKSFGFTAEDWFDVLCSNLVAAPFSVDIGVANFHVVVEFIAADNCSTNQRLCTLARCPMLGCDSHRLNLEVGRFIGPEQRTSKRGVVTQEEGGLRPLVNKIDNLMGELKTLKNASLLRTKKRINATRCYSLFTMLIELKKIREYLASIENFPLGVTRLIPTAVENTQIDLFIDDLKKFESVSQALQRDGDRMVSKMGARAMFGSLIAHFENRRVAPYEFTYITPDATIVHTKHFENGIVKLQEGKEQTLTTAEKTAVKIYLTSSDEDRGGRGE